MPRWRSSGSWPARRAPPAAAPAAAAHAGSFDGFVQSLWPEAHAKGVSRQTFEAAFLGVTPDPSVMEKTRSQAEFRKTVAEYLDTAVSEKRIALGREKYADYARWLAKAEDRFGVDRYIIMGVWGLETKYGTYTGNDYVVRSLATLAYARYRGTYFRTELIKALVILQEGHIDPAHMLGSWAGAMGQTQFMPSNFKPYAVDFENDGRRDIWTSVPDAVGSTANFLRKHGWIPGETWGYEVVLPGGFGERGVECLRALRHLGEPRRDAGRRRRNAPRGPRRPAPPRRRGRAGLPVDAQLQGHQELQQLDLLRARGLPARRPHRRLGPVEGTLARR